MVPETRPHLAQEKFFFGCLNTYNVTVCLQFIYTQFLPGKGLDVFFYSTASCRGRAFLSRYIHNHDTHRHGDKCSTVRALLFSLF